VKQRLIVRSTAEVDIGEAAVWYERERRGLGHRFLDELENCLSALSVVHSSSQRLRMASGAAY
jgi:hypothetical protein